MVRFSFVFSLTTLLVSVFATPYATVDGPAIANDIKSQVAFLNNGVQAFKNMPTIPTALVSFELMTMHKCHATQRPLFICCRFLRCYLNILFAKGD